MKGVRHLLNANVDQLKELQAHQGNPRLKEGVQIIIDIELPTTPSHLGEGLGNTATCNGEWHMTSAQMTVTHLELEVEIWYNTQFSHVRNLIINLQSLAHGLLAHNM
jgi:hypothetical protein